MTYVIPAPEAETKGRYVEIVDPAEIAAARSHAMNAPIYADGPDGKVYAEILSLRQFRGEDVEIEL